MIKRARSIVTAAAVIFGLPLAAFSQADADSLQRTLAKLIGKFSGAASDIKIRECRVSLNIDAASFSIVEPNSRTIAGGGFPTDESGGYLSSGPGRETIVPVTYLRFKFALGDVDPERISVVPAKKKEHSFIVLNTDGGAALIEVARSGKTVRTESKMYLEVRNRGADETAEAFRNAVRACE